MFFDNLPKSSFALTNRDDRNGEVMLQSTRARKFSYGLLRPADYKAKVLDNAPTGLHLSINEREVYTRLIGKFNAYNMLAAFGVADLLGQETSETLIVLSQLQPAAGRFEQIADPSGQNRIGIVDYAHTPDALEKVLRTLGELRRSGQRILTVVGCGGDRDRSKRPKMAQVAIERSDFVILTNDNPRTEDPAEILREMVAGIPLEESHRSRVIANRREAIQTAVRASKHGDIILVAGKGHETYQEIDGVKYDFDDREELEKSLQTS